MEIGAERSRARGSTHTIAGHNRNGRWSSRGGGGGGGGGCGGGGGRVCGVLWLHTSVVYAQPRGELAKQATPLFPGNKRSATGKTVHLRVELRLVEGGHLLVGTVRECCSEGQREREREREIAR
jgi:hypothetical protein